MLKWLSLAIIILFEFNTVEPDTFITEAVLQGQGFKVLQLGESMEFSKAGLLIRSLLFTLNLAD